VKFGRSLESLARLFPADGMARKVSTVASGSAIGFGVYFIATPLLTRLYSPVDFGILGTYLSILGIFAAAPSLAFDRAIPIAKDEDTARSFLMLAFCSILLTSLLASAVVLVISILPNYKITNSLGRLGFFIWLLPFGVIAEGTRMALAWWAIRQRAYKKLAIAKISQGFSQTIIQVGFGIFSGGPLPLLIGDTIGRSMGSSSLLSLGNVYRDVLSIPRRAKEFIKLAWDFRKFSILEVFNSYVITLGLQLPILLLASHFSPLEIGIFVMAERLLSAPVTLIGTSVSQVYAGEMSLILREQPNKFRSSYLNILKRLNWIGLLLATFVAIFSPLLIGLLLGKQWNSVGLLMAVRTPMFWSQIIVLPVSNFLTLLQKQGIQVYWSIARLLVISISILAGIYSNWSLNKVAAVYSLVACLSYGVLLLLIYVYSPQRELTT
jgi:O-antigen/teichoic acid export membrane protein